ncbi:MAG: hypothetical protein E5V25_00120 [Mesorhizobium sp.]|nr:MAG: hypothetical protein E5V34_02680 [Mesorhizobium sp.]TIX74867.1 MAG: hypothetical protein E5V25_00120 [Mesorhizobium sp.]TIX96580.1 MAG: hypothetical protein E5V24_00320 [Mesorhizobium sp.]
MILASDGAENKEIAALLGTVPNTVVGLYLALPERALVLCVDEKNQIQALNHTLPCLPMRPARSSGAATVTRGMEPFRSSLRSIRPSVRSSGTASSAIVRESF